MACASLVSFFDFKLDNSIGVRVRMACATLKIIVFSTYNTTFTILKVIIVKTTRDFNTLQKENIKPHRRWH